MDDPFLKEAACCRRLICQIGQQNASESVNSIGSTSITFDSVVRSFDGHSRVNNNLVCSKLQSNTWSKPPQALEYVPIDKKTSSVGQTEAGVGKIQTWGKKQFQIGDSFFSILPKDVMTPCPEKTTFSIDFFALSWERRKKEPDRARF